MEEIKKEFGRQAGVQQEKEKQIKINFGENLRKFWDLTGNHLMEIYGQYGTGKSRLVHYLAVEAQNAGYKVIYLDTEGGLSEEHISMLNDYEYIGDELDDLMKRVYSIKEQRHNWDILIVDSIGHPVYVHYVQMRSMQEQLKSYQKLAALFRDMVRFARGEKGKDYGKRKGLAIAINHTVSEFAKMAKPPEHPLWPFGGQIHRVPKLILRSEPVNGSTFKLITFKARNLPKEKEICRFTIGSKNIKIQWEI